MKSKPVMNWKKMEAAIRKAMRSEKNNVHIKDTAAYPLAFNVPMPGGHEYENGHTSFQFGGFTCEGLADIRLDAGNCIVEQDRVHLSLLLKTIHVKGRYSINARKAERIDLDTAGTMLEFDEQPDTLKAAGARKSANTPNLTPDEAQAFLDNARDQRTRLMDTPNGQQLMGVYNEHNEIYNEVFVKSAAARNSWNAGGVTAQMAKDTHVAVTNDGVVNPDNKMYGKISYNGNAFVQQMNMCIGAMNIDPDFDPWQPGAKPDPNSKYVKASLAAISFGKAVNTTGNNDKKIVPLTATQVYGQVDSFSQQMPESSVDELQNILSQSTGNGGADEAAKNGWLILDEAQRGMVRNWIYMGMRERAEKENAVSQPLWTGDCTATILDTVIEMELALLPGAGVDIKSTQINLPAFAFNIDDAAWTGAAADIARERLSQVYFVKSLVSNQVETGIRNGINASVIKAFKN